METYLLGSLGEERFSGLEQLPWGAMGQPLPSGHGRQAVSEAAGVFLRLSVRRGEGGGGGDSAEVVVTVTPPCVSHGPRNLLAVLAAVRHRVNLDVALAAGVCMVSRARSDSGGSWDPRLLLLLLLPCEGSAAFCRH